MKQHLEQLFAHQTLDTETAKSILIEIGEGKYAPSQIASFLTVFRMRAVTVEEMIGFRDAMLELCKPVNLSAYDPIDLCGTGGDGKNTFNISTLSAFVTAGAGVKVAKHGNYGVSSACGSSNVMEALGYQFPETQEALEQQIESTGITFLHAPKFHPAMKNVAPIRRELGIKTFFNMLGPMVNPAKPKKQLVGVFSLELLRLYQYLYQESEKQYLILHALDGYDEISLTGPFKVVSKTSDQVLNPIDLNLPTLTQESLFGGKDVPEAAKIFTKILGGEGTEAQNSVVTANAGMAIHCARPQLSRETAIEMAKESLHSGAAFSTLKKLISA